MSIPTRTWTQSIRFRLTVTYSVVLFGVSAVAVAAIYLGLSTNVEAAPLEPVQVQQLPPETTEATAAKVRKGLDDQWHVEQDATFVAADFEAVEAAVNYELLSALRRFSAIALAALFAASLAIGWWLSGRALRPVRQITATAREISATDLSRRIALAGPRDELRTLAETLDGMLGRLHEAFTAQRQLVDDASHELRNPLAVVQSNLEAVLSHDDVPPGDRARAATVAARATSRMRHVVEDLLAAARCGSPAFVDAPVELAAVAGDVADEHELLAQRCGRRLTRWFDGHPVVAGDAHAIHRAVDNLLANAERFSPEGAEVAIGTGSRDGWAWLGVQDHGAGVAPAEQDRIFDRAYTASTGPAAGAGLGLAIVRQIAEGHDGTVAVHSAAGQGSTFVLWLPERHASGISSRSPHPPPDNPMSGAPDSHSLRCGM